jgi:hypothetical protein
VATIQSTVNLLTLALLIIRSSLPLWLFSEDASSGLLKKRTNVPREVVCSISAVRLLISLTVKYIRETNQRISEDTHTSNFSKKSTTSVLALSISNSFTFEKLGWRSFIRVARFAKLEPCTLSEVS